MTDNQQLAKTLRTVHRQSGWWIIGGLEMGPYRTKGEAHEDRIGVMKFLRHGHKRGFITSSK